MISQKILVIGAGELGFQILSALAEHPRRPVTIAVLLRPGRIDSSSPQKQQQNVVLRQLGIDLIPGDIVEDSVQTLASIFAQYDTVIGCAGYATGLGVQPKITRAALLAEIPRFIPWQFGVDFEVIGRGSPQDLFDEQLDVREILRSQDKTQWTIVSTGMFTSYLFEPFFGVVDLENSCVNALGSLENQVTLTTPQDIGLVTAEIVLGDEDSFSNEPIFIGGDTISYEELAQLIQGLTGKYITRNVLTMEMIQTGLASDPHNRLLKYQAIFGQGHGVAWDLSSTWNQRRGLRAKTAEEWARENWAGAKF